MPGCNYCIVNDHEWPGCSTCKNANHSFPQCASCVNPNQEYPECTKCISHLHVHPKCSYCTNTLHAYPMCSECKISGHTYPQCDYCQDGFYNYTDHENNCTSCDCDSTGSFDDICEKKTGQCECKMGFGGSRRCDVCEFGTGKYPNCGGKQVILNLQQQNVNINSLIFS